VEGVSGASVAAALSQEYPVVKLGNRMRCDVLARFPEGKPPWRRVSLRVVSSMRIGHGFGQEPAVVNESPSRTRPLEPSIARLLDQAKVFSH
jgi:hypothetical protein